MFPGTPPALLYFDQTRGALTTVQASGLLVLADEYEIQMLYNAWRNTNKRLALRNTNMGRSVVGVYGMNLDQFEYDRPQGAPATLKSSFLLVLADESESQIRLICLAKHQQGTVLFVLADVLFRCRCFPGMNLNQFEYDRPQRAPATLQSSFLLVLADESESQIRLICLAKHQQGTVLFVLADEYEIHMPLQCRRNTNKGLALRNTKGGPLLVFPGSTSLNMKLIDHREHRQHCNHQVVGGRRRD